jgi:hypothetical protein
MSPASVAAQHEGKSFVLLCAEKSGRASGDAGLERALKRTLDALQRELPDVQTAFLPGCSAAFQAGVAHAVVEGRWLALFVGCVSALAEWLSTRMDGPHMLALLAVATVLTSFRFIGAVLFGMCLLLLPRSAGAGASSAAPVRAGQSTITLTSLTSTAWQRQALIQEPPTCSRSSAPFHHSRTPRRACPQ